jgi:hypothetical protein
MEKARGLPHAQGLTCLSVLLNLKITCPCCTFPNMSWCSLVMESITLACPRCLKKIVPLRVAPVHVHGYSWKESVRLVLSSLFTRFGNINIKRKMATNADMNDHGVLKYLRLKLATCA